MTFWTDERIALLSQLVGAGMTANAIADRLGCSFDMVKSKKRRLGLKSQFTGNGADWNDERVATLKHLWNNGYSARDIANEIGGITRYAVIGKAHRLGLSGLTKKTRPKQPSEPRRPRSRKYLPRPKPSPAAPIFAEPIPAYTGTPLSILECSDLRCRYPVRNDPFGACGAPVKPGKPYCAHHAARCFIPLDDRKKRISRLADLVDAEHAAKRVRA